MKKLIVVGLLLVGLSGCTSAQAEINNSEMVSFVVKGKTIDCLMNNVGLKSQSMSCDWVAYHGLDKK